MPSLTSSMCNIVEDYEVTEIYLSVESSCKILIASTDEQDKIWPLGAGADPRLSLQEWQLRKIIGLLVSQACNSGVPEIC